ncbi:hypothetical protein BDZ97DRAFT_1842531 [Flammula alnicola]|nr:hypothetical protein BDZ97DRAFT_1842531 [Flammula alnicola]
MANHGGAATYPTNFGQGEMDAVQVAQAIVEYSPSQPLKDAAQQILKLFGDSQENKGGFKRLVDEGGALLAIIWLKYFVQPDKPIWQTSEVQSLIISVKRALDAIASDCAEANVGRPTTYTTETYLAQFVKLASAIAETPVVPPRQSGQGTDALHGPSSIVRLGNGNKILSSLTVKNNNNATLAYPKSTKS